MRSDVISNAQMRKCAMPISSVVHKPIVSIGKTYDERKVFMNARTFRRIFFTLSTCFLLVLLTFSFLGRAAQTSDEEARARMIIAQLRKVTYGQIGAENVKGLTLIWKTRHQRLNGDQDTGEIICDLSLPNKMLTKATQTFSGRAQAVTTRLLNGDQSLSDLNTSIARAGGTPSNDQAKQLQGIRREQAIVLMRLALPPSPDFPLIYKYVGEAKADDGQADVIDVKGPNAFSARLYIDKTSSRILMMTLPDQGGNVRLDSKGKREPLSNMSGEMKFRFSDYRPERGVMLPHLMTYEHRGRIVSEYEFKSFQLNPLFEPDHFDPRKKRESAIHH